MRDTGGPGREWPRAAGLLGLLLATSVVRPAVLVALPLLLLALAAGGGRPRAVVVALLALLPVLGGGPGPGLWYLERGWALMAGGWFVALSLRWPGSAFLLRGLGGIAGGAAGGLLYFSLRPGEWAVVEWTIRSRLQGLSAQSLEAFRLLQGGEVATGMTELMIRMAEWQAAIFPALLALATLAGMGLAGWIWARAGNGGAVPPGPIREVRFPDPLVWVLIGGILLILLGEGGWSRAGVNLVALMSALLVLRGTGVLVHLNGGIRLPGVLLVVLGLIFAGPVLLGAAWMVGLGDTWLDLRARAGRNGGVAT